MSELVIEVGDLVVDYGKGVRSVRAVSGVSFEVKAGECVGFIGANGAGKSTTMKALMGFLFPTSGTVEVLGAKRGRRGAGSGRGIFPRLRCTIRS